LRANLKSHQSKLKEFLEKVFNRGNYIEYKNQITTTKEKYNPSQRTMWEYVHYNVVRYVPIEVSRGELELLSQKIIVGINAVTTDLILKFRGTGILPQECQTRHHVICCTSEGEAYCYL
jgi:hypothetical protein